jgi:hypothetical protein
MSALTDVERIAVAIALVIVFALCVLSLRRMTDAERRLADAERRLTNAERQSLPDSNKQPIGFWHFESA